MDYKRIIFLVIIFLAVVSLGVAGTYYLKYGLASLLTQPIQDQSSANFAVLAGSTVTNTGASAVTGDVGLSPGISITGFPPGTISGTQYMNNAVAAQGQADFTTAYNEAVAKPCTHDYSGTDMGTLTLTPGVYCFTSSAQLTGTLTLDGGNDPNAVFIFKIGTTLTTATSSAVSLIRSAQSCNVFWTIGTSATLGTGTIFKGNILALASATLVTGTSVDGRVWAHNGAVTLDTNAVSAATCTATPINGTCGTAAKSYLYTDATFSGTMCGNGSGVTDPASPTFPTAGNSVTWTCGGSNLGNPSSICTATRAAAPVVPTCTISASPNPTNSGSTSTITWSSANATGCTATGGSTGWSGARNTADSWTSGTLTQGYTYSMICTGAGGDSSSCSVAVTINPAPASGVPGVPGGTGFDILKVEPPLIDVVKVPSHLALPNGPGPVIYTYTLRNPGTIPLTSITMVDDTCSPIIYISGDTNSDTKLDVNETWTYDCFKTLSATHTNTVTATGWANGISAVDIATATVVVGVPIVPPLIHVTKIPSPLALPAGGGAVTYTYTVTNPGTASLSNVSITDDKCTGLPGRVLGHPGDLNKNDLLENNETWTFTCQSSITKTTTNTATASGQANGLTARDFAIATVVVASPNLPNTGFAPEEQ